MLVIKCCKKENAEGWYDYQADDVDDLNRLAMNIRAIMKVGLRYEIDRTRNTEPDPQGISCCLFGLAEQLMEPIVDFLSWEEIKMERGKK